MTTIQRHPTWYPRHAAPTGTLAWTGGCRPAALRDIGKRERDLVSSVFRAAMREVFAYWGDGRGLNDSTLEMARIQWKRARYTAHATLRA